MSTTLNFPNMSDLCRSSYSPRRLSAAGFNLRLRIAVFSIIGALGLLAGKSALAQEDFVGVELPETFLEDAAPKDETPPAGEQAAEGELVGVELPAETSDASLETAAPLPAQADTKTAAALPEQTDSPKALEPASEPPKPWSADQGPTKTPKKSDKIFASVSFSPQVGYLFFPKSEFEFNGMKASVDPRNGLTVKLHLDLGGDGFGFEFAPFYALEYGGIRADADGFANLSGVDFGKSGAGAGFQAAGGELAIVYRFSIKKFFPHIGVGFRGAYLFGDQISYGTELYARFPVGFTAYLGKHIAFVMDVGLMVGATGIRTSSALPEVFDTMPPELRQGLAEANSTSDFEAWYSDNSAEIDQWISDNQDTLPEGYSQGQMASDFVSEQMSKSIRFGTGFGMDIMIGVRFP